MSNLNFFRIRHSPYLIFCKLGFGIILIVESSRLYSGGADWIFMNNINLIFHEAGHVIFLLFGPFLHVLGGTIGEILIPFIVTCYFALSANLYATGFGLWWLSTALWSVGVYAKDARTQALPLLTGDSSGHDWTYLLNSLGILPYDSIVGNTFLFFSMLTFSLALLLFYFDITGRKLYVGRLTLIR